MANLAVKDGIYLIPFRFRGNEYKRSLKTRNRSAAEAAKNSVELTIHRLLTGMTQLPASVDVGISSSAGALRPRQPPSYPCPICPARGP